MSETSAVGGLTLPVSAGAANAELADPAVAGIARFLAWALNNDLSAKLAQMAGTSLVAVPAANVYPWAPDKHWQRSTLPGLWCAWGGKSKRVPHTTVYDRRERRIDVFYAFSELVAPNGLRSRAGLMAAAEASIAKACDRGRHESYAPTGYPAGTPIARACGLLQWQYEGAEQQFTASIPAPGRAGTSADGHVVRGYPSIKASILIWERLDGHTLEDPTDAAGEVLVTINGSDGESTDTIPILERIVSPPDGDEE
jgi:hypothetical protein